MLPFKPEFCNKREGMVHFLHKYGFKDAREYKRLWVRGEYLQDPRIMPGAFMPLLCNSAQCLIVRSPFCTFKKLSLVPHSMM